MFLRTARCNWRKSTLTALLGRRTWHKCTGCTDKADTAEHTFKQKTSTTQHWEECSVCNYKKDVKSHSWGNWTLTVNPTATTTGTADRTCSCGEKQTKADVPNLSDTSVWSKDDTQHVEPTEEAEGRDVYKSADYGEVIVTLDRLPHTLVHVDEIPAAETSEGTKEHWHCEGCGKDFADEDGTKEVTADDLKIRKLDTEVRAPMNVEISTPIEELIKAVLTDDEQQKIEEGTYIKITLIRKTNPQKNLPNGHKI